MYLQNLMFSYDDSSIVAQRSHFPGGDVDINVSAETFSEIKFLPKYNPQLEATGSDERNLMLYGPQTNTIGQKYEFRYINLDV